MKISFVLFQSRPLPISHRIRHVRTLLWMEDDSMVAHDRGSPQINVPVIFRSRARGHPHPPHDNIVIWEDV